MSKTRRPKPSWETRQRKESRYVLQKVREEERAKEAQAMLDDEAQWNERYLFQPSDDEINGV